MKRIEVWHLTEASASVVETNRADLCEHAPEMVTAKCALAPAFVLTWVTNPPGLPGMGTKNTEFVCWYHLHTLMTAATAEASGPVLVTVIDKT